MADRALIVGDSVQIDGKGCGIITEKVMRGFGTFFMVKLTNTDFEFEIEEERLKLTNIPSSSGSSLTRVQTTDSSMANSTRFQHVNEENITEFRTTI